MATPVSSSMFTYLQENVSVKRDNSTNKVKIVKQAPQVKIEFKNHIPLYNLYAAAGTFSELQSDKSFTQIEAPEKYQASNDYFACKVMGESMNRRIPNGSICVFKKYTGGSRNGKIVLVENSDIQDPDFNSAFTVKTYASEKTINEDGTWSHKSIVLRPNSTDSSYEDIVLSEEDARGMKIIGEFAGIL